MTIEWKKIKEGPFRAGYRRLIKKTFRLPNGTVQNFDIKDEKPAVSILAITQDNKVVLTKQFRPGMEKVLLEIPGGAINKEEKPVAAAKRELLEETGYTGSFQSVGTSFDCAYSNRVRYNFVATNCQKIQEQHLDDSEFVELKLITIDALRTHLRSGELTDVESGYLALDYLNLL